MKKYSLIILLLFVSTLVFAKLRVVTTYPYIKDMTQKIGGDMVKVSALAKGNFDPHTIVPKPSLIGKVRQADMLVINGAQLEIGWLPPLLQQANNQKVRSGGNGFLDLSNHVKLIQVPESVSREHGDIHPAGNPHFCLDPYNLPKIAKAILDKLSELDMENMAYYDKNYHQFMATWKQKVAEYDKKFSEFSGKNYIEYHKNLDYLLERYHMKVVKTVEPLPGIPPTPKHCLGLIRLVKNIKIEKILHDVYHSKKSSKFLSDKTGIPYEVMPHDVEAVKEAKDIFSLYDEIYRRLKK